MDGAQNNLQFREVWEVHDTLYDKFKEKKRSTTGI
jgi:hypothetical protein